MVAAAALRRRDRRPLPRARWCCRSPTSPRPSQPGRDRPARADRPGGDLDARRALRRARRRVRRVGSPPWRACSPAGAARVRAATGQRAAVPDPQRPHGLGPYRAPSRGDVGPGWALAVDAATWPSPPSSCSPSRSRRGPPRAEAPVDRAGAAGGLDVLPQPPLALGRGARLRCAQHDPRGALVTLGPAVADDTIGRQGWGFVLSAEAAGLLLMTFVLLRVRLERPLLLGMLGIAMLAPPMLLLGVSPRSWSASSRRPSSRVPASRSSAWAGTSPCRRTSRTTCSSGPTPTTCSAPSSRCRSDSSPGVRWPRRSASSGCSWPRPSRTPPLGLVLCSRSVRNLPDACRSSRCHGDD